MKRTTVLFCCIIVLTTGCESLRFAPDQTQKTNAWLHLRTTQLAADMAETEQTSVQLQNLTALAHHQSRAFTAYYGLPKELPSAYTPEQILSNATISIAEQAKQKAAQRPDIWKTADGVLELSIAVAGILGGVCGTGILRYLKTAREKTKAIKEIIDGNESLKQTSQTVSELFKQAHKNQSSSTKILVTKTKVKSDKD